MPDPVVAETVIEQGNGHDLLAKVEGKNYVAVGRQVVQQPLDEVRRSL
jgi:hypothetical protein